MEPRFVLEASKRHASGLAYAPDGTLYTGGMEGVLRHWDGDRLIEELKGHTASVNSIDWCGGRLVTGGSDKRVLWWDGGAVADEWPGYSGFATDGKVMLLRKDRGNDVYLRVPGGDAVRVATGLERLGGVWYVPGAWLLAGIGSEVQVRAIDDAEYIGKLDGHDTAVTSISVAQNDARVVITDYAGQIHVWDVAKKERILKVASGSTGYVFGAISPDGKHIAVAGEGIVTLRDAAGQVLATHKPGIKGLYGLCWSPDSKSFANAGADGRVRVYPV